MTITGSGQISIFDIATELGISATNESLDSLASKTLNDCSAATPNPTNPDSISEWYGYNHSATPSPPATNNAFMAGAGISAANHDNHLLISGSLVACATNIEVHSSTTEFGTYTLLDTSFDYDNTGVLDSGLGAEVQMWYKSRGLATSTNTTGSFSSAFTGKTGPTSPKSFGASSGTGTTNDYNVNPTWNNGNASPGALGDRNMDALEWRRNINGGSWTGYTSLSAGAITFNDNLVSQGLVNDDLINYEIRYTAETAAATATHTVLLTV